MRQYLIAGNWKMHGTQSTVLQLALDLSAITIPNNVAVAVFPTNLHLAKVSKTLANTPIKIGAQNCAMQMAQGALTGEVSSMQLKDAGCDFVLVGHSERRQFCADSDAILIKKFNAACEANLAPVLCVGENLEQRQAGNYQQVINAQIAAIIDEVSINSFAQAVIAYEPVWSIGTGLAATAMQAQEVHAGIRQFLATYDVNLAKNMQILYGGSLNPNNAKDLLAMPDVNGGLVGGASLVASDFSCICRIAGELGTC